MLENKQLDILEKVYKFCNYTTAHVSKEDDYSSRELINHIKEFLDVKKKFLEVNKVPSMTSHTESKEEQSFDVGMQESSKDLTSPQN
ncbi:hypothetical protein COTS27_00958 [Spirochaetota bacterium]|nr:hypothetical protein COTS27_00958 [Spirochaetota bacterium]